jgi:tetratricopeptide (TPR) repeat protein
MISRNYLETLLNSNPSFKPVVLNIIAGMYLNDNRYEEAMQFYDLIIIDYPGTYDAINALFEKFFAALHIADDIYSASQIFSQLQSLNITDEDS